jgi:hypothetical protein
MMERMFAQQSDFAVDENGASCGNFRAKSTTVDEVVENDPQQSLHSVWRTRVDGALRYRRAR